MTPQEAVLSLWWDWNDGMPTCFGSHFPCYLEALYGTEHETLARQTLTYWKGVSETETTDRISRYRWNGFTRGLKKLYAAVGLPTENSRIAAALDLAMKSPDKRWACGCHWVDASRLASMAEAAARGTKPA